MFKEFKWKNRLLIYAYDNYNKKEFCEIEAFFVKNIEAINQRKLLLIKLNINNINNINNIKTGLVLIGLDGTEKFHSSNNDLLDNLFNIIDSMPMRITEINKNKKNAII